MHPEHFVPKHFQWAYADGVGTITLNRPDRRNALTFDSYAELRDTFRALGDESVVHAVVMQGAGGHFCSGGDVNDIIGPLVKMDRRGRAEFTRMTGDLIVAMLTCRPVIVAAVDGSCVGAGAAVATASDIRFGTPDARVGFVFVRVGLAGCDMGACAMLPRIVGHGRAAELLYTGRIMGGEEAHAVGFFNRLSGADKLAGDAATFAREIANGPTLAHRTTKRMLLEEWSMDVVAAVAAEAHEQARLMESNDFRRAYEAFLSKEAPRFEGD